MKIPIQCDACGKKYRVDAHYAGKRARCKVCNNPMIVPKPLDPTELDESQQIIRHSERARPAKLAAGDPESIEAIADHIEEHIGEIDGVFHEIVSDLVHVDIHHVPPSDARPYHTLISTGMSDEPMNVPPEALAEGVSPYAEVMICLPPDWQLSDEAFRDESWYWPVHWLKILARLPHEYDTWLGLGHTIPNSDPPAPFAENTKLCCIMLLPPLTTPNSFRQLRVNDEKTIDFWGVVPLYAEEVEFKLRHGAEPLMNRFNEFEISELLDINRPNVCKRG